MLHLLTTWAFTQTQANGDGLGKIREKNKEVQRGKLDWGSGRQGDLGKFIVQSPLMYVRVHYNTNCKALLFQARN